MPPSPERHETIRPVGKAVRFAAFEKLIHWVIAVAMLTLLATGLILWVPALSAHLPRPLINRIHIDTGITATIVMILSLIGPWGRTLRKDLHELMIAPVDQLNSWTGVIGDWLHRAAPSPESDRPERFNVGQRLFTAAMGALAILAVLTGFALRTPGRIPLSIQGGAEFTHELVFFIIFVLVIGHITKALMSLRRDQCTKGNPRQP
ncbi:cytochrome b/b6 domain-containing protein [Ferrimicrobium sp.]|uniref:cytochrome b/b6 domain-containing protein n=1 Tax=Ferrimicrobium sp. TaxID=2926050 RepID=UPI002620A2BE|nr:cytochrome b/b6 domain-containing protein [Ferrimicrobium sp.]